MTIEAGGTPVNATQLSELRSNLGIIDFVAGGQTANSVGADSIVFSNSNGLSFGLDAPGGSVLTGSYTVPETSAFLTTAALSNHSHGNPTLALTNLTGTTASASNGLTLSLSAANQTVQTQGSVQINGSTGSIVFSNSNGITFGGNASTITASHNGLTTAALSNHSHGNPSLALTNLSGSTASNSAGLTISLSADMPQPGIAASAGTQSASNGTIVFANSNGITFGMSNSSQITASHNGLTIQSNQAVSAGNGSSAFQTLSMVDAGGVTWSTVAGGLQASVKTDYLTTAALSNHSHGNPTLALTNLTGTTASNSAGLTLSLSGPAAVTTNGLISGINVSAGTTSNNLSALTFSNGSGVTFGLNGSVLTASVAAVAGAQTGISGIANSQTTFSSGTVSFSELGAITIRSTTGNQFQFSVNAQSNAGISAGNGSSTFQTLSFADGGGVSWSTVGGGLQATVKTDYLTTAALSNHSHGNPTLALTNLTGTTASASNGLTLSLSAAAQVAQTNQSIGIYASSQTYGQSSSSTFDARSLSVVGSGGISVGMSAGSLLISGQTTAGATVFSNSNNVSFGLNGSTVTATASFAQTAQTMGIYASSQTYGQSSSSAVDARSLSIVGSGGVSVGMSAGSLLISGQTTLAQSAQTQSNVQGIIVSDTTYRTGDVSFKNANGASFGSSGANIVTLSYSVPSVAGLLSAVNLSAGTTSNNLSAMVFSNSNGISFGLNGSTVTGSHNAITTGRASNDAIGLNTAKTNVTWTVNSSGLSFDAGGYAGTGFTSTTTAGTAIVATHNTAGLSLAFPTIITNPLTTARASNDAVGLNTALTANGVAWTVNSSGISLNIPAFLTTAALSNHSHGNPTLALTNLSGTTASASNGLTLSLSAAAPGAATLSVYAVSNTTQGTSGTASLLSFGGAGGISAGFTNGSIVISGPDLTSLSVTGALSASSNGSTISLGVGTVTASIIGNTTQTSTGTVNLNALVFSGAGGASLGISAGSIIVSGAAGGGGGAGISAGTQSVSTGTVVFSNSNGVTFGMSGSSRVTASVETSYAASNHSHSNPTLALTNLTGTTASASNGLTLSLSVAAPDGGIYLSAAGSSQSAGNIVFSNSNGVSFGMAGSTVTASVQAGAAAGIGALGASNTTYTSGTVSLVAGAGAITIGSDTGQRISFAVPQTSSLVGASGISISTNGSTISVYQAIALSRFIFEPPGASSAGSAMTQGSMSFQRVFIPENMSISRIDVPCQISLASSAAANTGVLLISSGLVVYSVSGTSTLNPIVGAFGTTTYTHASNTANFNSITGPRYLSFGIATVLSAGEYYVGVQLSTNNNSSIGTATTAIAATISIQHGAIYTASQWQEFGAVTATSVNMRPFVGVAASVTATGQTQQLSNITQTGTALMRANIPVIFRNF